MSLKIILRNTVYCYFRFHLLKAFVLRAARPFWTWGQVCERSEWKHWPHLKPIWGTWKRIKYNYIWLLIYLEVRGFSDLQVAYLLWPIVATSTVAQKY